MKYVPLLIVYNSITVALDMKIKLVYFQVYSINDSCDNRGAISVYNGANSRYLFGVIFYSC